MNKLTITDEYSRKVAMKVNTEWVDLPDHEEFYIITRSGQVFSKTRSVNSPICGGSREIKGKEINPWLCNQYYAIEARRAGEKRTVVYIHRALAKAFIPNHEGKPCINHIDGNKQNNDLSNLEWCTHKENMQHAHRTGLIPPSNIGPGEKSLSAKLNNKSVVEIKKALIRGVSTTSLAKKYSVTPGTIDHIKKGRTWSHIVLDDEL